MDSLTLGYLVGRLVAPLLLVWIACFLVAKGNFGRSVTLIVQPYGLMAIALLFLVLLARVPVTGT